MSSCQINYKDKFFIKEVFFKSLPLIIGSIMMGLTNLLDNFMIGIFQGPEAVELSAASLGLKYTKILNIFTQAAIAMFGFLIFQFKGANKRQEVQAVIRIMLKLVIIVNLLGILIGWLATEQILHFFQGSNFDDPSTKLGIAQSYLKSSVFTLLPMSIYTVFLIGLNAYGKQKIVLPLAFLSLLINVLFNFLFYKVFGFGLNGIVYSTILANWISVIVMIIWIFYVKLNKILLFNIILFFRLWDLKIFKLGLKRLAMSLQSILWSSISLGVTIIYSIWFGDVANERMAIVGPITMMFYSALDGISATKGYFVGSYIGGKNPKQALINDKRINLYTVLVALIEGSLLVILAYFLPKAWISVDDVVQKDCTYMLIAVGLTYPIAALSKTLLGSFKVAGMGKVIILSNGLFALLFEFCIPLTLMLLAQYTSSVNLEFWEVFLISRVIKLLKLPPTYFFWKKLNWLKRAF